MQEIALALLDWICAVIHIFFKHKKNPETALTQACIFSPMCFLYTWRDSSWDGGMHTRIKRICARRVNCRMRVWISLRANHAECYLQTLFRTHISTDLARSSSTRFQVQQSLHVGESHWQRQTKQILKTCLLTLSAMLSHISFWQYRAASFQALT